MIPAHDPGLVSTLPDRHEWYHDEGLGHLSIATTSALVQDGPTATVDVVFDSDRQPRIDNFVEGVWRDFAFADDELSAIEGGTPTHLVLVDAVDRALDCVLPLTTATCLSADFLSFRHMTAERFAQRCSVLDVAFVGWPGSPADPTTSTLGEIAVATSTLLVITFGAAGVRVVDGRAAGSPQWFDVDAVPVTGTTIGCGDAFIAAFLATWNRTDDIEKSVAAGQQLGAAATSWQWALPPPGAYSADDSS